MKRTVFVFGVETTVPDTKSVLQDATTALRGIRGVKAVDVVTTAVQNEIHVTVTFANSKRAMAIHRNLMLTLGLVKGLRITEARTVISDLW